MQQPTRLTRNNINKMIESFSGDIAVTIYIPTNFATTPPNMTEDQIRTKNLFRAAMEKLGDTDVEQNVSERLQQQLNEMLDNVAFWQSLTRGLLICADKQQLQLFYLPIDTEEYVAVADTFHLAQIFGLLEDAEQYYVLALAQHEPMLYEGTLYDLQPSAIELPESLEAALNIDEANQKSEQQRSINAAPGMSFNGRGGARSPVEDDRQKFWRMIDNILCAKASVNNPLVLAGTEKDLSEYRAASHYPHILEQAVHGSYGAAQMHELLSQATAIIEHERVDARHKQARSTFNRLQGEQPNQVADELTEITTAAEGGRVDKLLIGAIRKTADTVRDSVEQVSVLTFETSQKMNTALQSAAMAVWKTGGSIISLEQSQMPRRGAYALATLRY